MSTCILVKKCIYFEWNLNPENWKHSCVQYYLRWKINEALEFSVNDLRAGYIFDSEKNF